MRTLVAVLLAATFLACPLLCRADVVGCCAEDSRGSCLPPDDPGSCGSCICDGAVKDTSLGDRGPVDSSFPPIPAPLPESLASRPFLLASDPFSTRPDRLAWLTSGRSRALLQNFRC